MFTMTYGARSPVRFSNQQISLRHRCPRGTRSHPDVQVSRLHQDPYGIMPAPTGTFTYLRRRSGGRHERSK